MDQGRGIISNGIWGCQENQLMIFIEGPIFLSRENLFGDSLSISVPTLQSKTNVLSVGNKNYKRQHTSYKLEMDFEPRDYSKSTTNQVSIRETEGREKSNKRNQFFVCITSRR